MTLLNNFSDSVNNINNKIKNPFTSDVDNPLRGPDFPEGFIIEELDFNSNNKTLNTVKLVGNMMPHVPFKFGGDQRVKKDYYAGYSEPVAQVLGPEEKNVEINGEFKEKRFYDDLYGVSTEIQELIDAIRIRGNLIRIVLGEWQRYGFIESCDFEMVKLSRIRYRISFSIIGFNAPKNAKFLEKGREVPFDINKDLIEEAGNFQQLYQDQIPTYVPISIGDKIRELTGIVADAISIVTGFIDNVLTTINDIKKAVKRAIGLIKHCQNKLREYKRIIGAFDPFDLDQGLTGRYESASYYNGAIAYSSGLTSTLEKMKARLKELSSNAPNARHFVRPSDTLQSIASKFYGSGDDWKQIYDYNELTSTELTNGTILEIPEL